MAGRSRSPPLAFIAPPTLHSFGPSSFAPQQFPLYKPTVGAEPSGAPPFAPPPFSSSEDTGQALSSLREKYQTLLSHEREGKELERSIWEAERQLYLSRIAGLESTVKDLHGQLDKCQSGQSVVKDPPEQPQAEDVTVGGELAQVHNEVVVLPGVEESEPVEIALPAPEPEPLAARPDSPPVEEPTDETARADSPGPPEYPYPKTPKSVRGDIEPDEAEIGNLLDQAGRILGKQPYGFHHYDDDDDEEEEFKLILKPNKNFTSSWAF